MSTAASIPVGTPQGDLHTLQRELASATDERIVRVLAVVDTLTDRGEADRLIAPLRGRLAELRPQRPLTLFRLLFAPLEPLIVAGRAWHPGSPGIPRAALGPLARAVRRELAGAAAPIEAAIARHAGAEMDVVAEVGAQLWPRAAAILATAPGSPEWIAAAGLPVCDHATLCRDVAAVLAHGATLVRLATRASLGIEPQTRQLRNMLASVAPAGPGPLAMMVALLMSWLPRSDRLLDVADRLAAKHADPAGRAAIDRAVNFVLDGLTDAPPPGPTAGRATHDIWWVATLLNDLKKRAVHSPSRAARIDEVRQRVDIACRENYANALDNRLLAPAARLANAGEAEVTTLEATARALRRFESTARLIGGADQYDRQLQRAAAALRPAANVGALARIDRIRLVEILQGPDAAEAMLNDTGG